MTLSCSIWLATSWYSLEPVLSRSAVSNNGLDKQSTVSASTNWFPTLDLINSSNSPVISRSLDKASWVSFSSQTRSVMLRFSSDILFKISPKNRAELLSSSSSCASLGLCSLSPDLVHSFFVNSFLSISFKADTKRSRFSLSLANCW